MTTPTVTERGRGSAHRPDTDNPATLPVLRVVRVSCALIEHQWHCNAACAARVSVRAVRVVSESVVRVVPSHRHRCCACGATVGGLRRA